MSDSDSDISRMEEGEVEDNEKTGTSKRTLGLGALGIVSAVVQIATLYIYRTKFTDTVGYLVLGACVLNLVMAPVASIMQSKRDKFGGMQDILDQMEEETERLKEENEELTSTIDEMGDSVSELKDIEGALSSLSGSQDSNVTEIVKLVQESKMIAQKQKSILKGNAIQQMVEIVLEAFQSSDSEVYLDDLGLEHLMMGLANVKALKIDKDERKERKVKREILSSDRTLKGILTIVNELAETSGIGDDIV